MGYAQNGYGYGYGGGYGAGAELIHLLFGAIFFIILIALAVILVRLALRGGRSMWMRQGSAMELLKERYVKGEIDRKEFEEKKKDLMTQ